MALIRIKIDFSHIIDAMRRCVIGIVGINNESLSYTLALLHQPGKNMSEITNEQVRIFISLFRGREDVFAVRWEKDGKNGYMPAYDFNWNEYFITKRMVVH